MQQTCFAGRKKKEKLRENCQKQKQKKKKLKLKFKIFEAFEDEHENSIDGKKETEIPEPNRFTPEVKHFKINIKNWRKSWEQLSTECGEIVARLELTGNYFYWTQYRCRKWWFYTEKRKFEGFIILKLNLKFYSNVRKFKSGGFTTRNCASEYFMFNISGVSRASGV